MENNAKQVNQEPDIVLSGKEKMLEFVATTMCFLLLMACLLKVLFF
ncbi:MAG: hypothetical protein IPM82_02145 [Saprospiraceae bacterium]|nr:hypothetical protein [Saprospiraceae bacterium]